MCTLVFGLDVLGPGTVVLATNRDEDPRRPSEGPQVLSVSPRVAGGRDARAGGTWMALRAAGPGRPAGVALLLNRRDPEPERAGRRSRGWLTLDVATAADPRVAALSEAATGRYAPCSLVWLSPAGSWLLAVRAGEPPELGAIAPGWHALAHHELDDPGDARTAHLANALRGFAPRTRADATSRLHALVADHGGTSAPPVCIHAVAAPTVSSARVWISAHDIAWAHAPGPPCTTAFEDWTHLVAPDAAQEDA